jgi:Ca2+-binding EF-hand superfamily protein
LSDAHPYAIDTEHCRQFTAIFDVHGDGVIRKDEFVDFARFLVIMSYMHSEEGQAQVSDGLKIMEGAGQIEDLIRSLERDRHQLRKVIPYLPDELRDELLGAQFIDQCRDRFKELDQNGSGSLEPHELYPIILEMTDAHHYALDQEQCQRFTAIFDDEKTGVISQAEFVNFARFLMVMSYLQTEHGHKALELANLDSQGVSAVVSTPTKSRQPASPGAQSTSSRRVLSPKAEVGHVSVDRDYYKSRADELGNENQAQRRKLLEMEENMRAMQEMLAKQDRTIRHAKIDLDDLNASR